MMKISKYLIIIIAAINLVSCSDFLDTKSNSTLPADFVFEREGDTYRAILGVYTILTSQQVYGQRISQYFCLNTDTEWGMVGSLEATDRRGLWDYTANSDNLELKQPWDEMFNGINRANVCIEGMENSNLFKNAILEPGKVRHMYGEVKTLRAILYLELIRNWGDVPMKMTPTKHLDNFYLGQTNRDSILDVLIADLIEAEPYMLPASKVENGIERVSRQTTQGMIARLSLTRGGYALRPDLNDPLSSGTMERPGNYLEFYQTANKYLREIYDSKTHQLLSDFKGVFFKQCQKEKTSTDDMMFEIAFAPKYGSSLGSNIGWSVDNNNNISYGYATPQTRFSLTYHYSFDPKDTRRDITCAIFGYKWANGMIEQYAKSWDQVTIGKWNILWTKTPLGAGSSGNTGINWPIMRYADILLLLAETENEINSGPTDLAKECLKQVRQRAFLPADHQVAVADYIATKTDYNTFFDAIVDERAWEFGGEAIRKYDLIRWNLLRTKLRKHSQDILDMGNDAAGNGYGPDKYKNLPAYIFWKKNIDGTLDFKGLNSNILPGDAEVVGYTSVSWMRSMVNIDGTLAEKMRNNWRSYVTAPEPMVYIFPIHKDNISDSQGALKNYYGKR